MAKIPSSLISRWADFGYDRDSWQESLLDFLYFINDENNPDTPLPSKGMACIIGQNPVGALSAYNPNDVLFHSTIPDEYFIKKPNEIRIMIQRNTGVFWFWDASLQRWYSAGNLNKLEEETTLISITSSIWNTKQIDLSRPVVSIPPVVHLIGSGKLVIDINYWMPDAKTITFATSSGPNSLGNFPIKPDVDVIHLRYHTTMPVMWGG